MKVEEFFKKYKKEILKEQGKSISSKILWFMFHKNMSDVEVVKDILKNMTKDYVYILNNDELELDIDYDKLRDLNETILFIFDYTENDIEQSDKFLEIIFDDEIVKILLDFDYKFIKRDLILQLFKLSDKDERFVEREIEIAIKYDFFDSIKCFSESKTYKDCPDCCKIYKVIFKKNSKLLSMISDELLEIVLDEARTCLWLKGCDSKEYMDVFIDTFLKMDFDMGRNFIFDLINDAINEKAKAEILFDALIKILDNDKNCRYSKDIKDELRYSDLTDKFLRYLSKKYDKSYYENKCVEISISGEDFFDAFEI